MSAKNVARRSNAARRTKYVLVATLTLIAALLWVPGRRDVPRFRALASGIPESELPFALQSGLGESYAAQAKIDADTARWVALGKSYQARSQAYGSGVAANPELTVARRLYGYSSVLAANPELSLARRAYAGSAAAIICNLRVAEDKLAANPELTFLNRLEAC